MEKLNFAGIQLQNIIIRLINNWYIVIISLILFLIGAFYQNRYTQRIYPVSASLIITEVEKTNGADLLYENTLIRQGRNYYNEPYILRSYPLVQKTVKELDFTTSIFEDGRIISTELYKSIPIKISRKITSADGEYLLKILDKENYLLEFRENSDTRNLPSLKYKFGKKIVFDANEFQIDTLTGFHLMDFNDAEYRILFRSEFDVAAEYVGKLDIRWAEVGAGVMNITSAGAIPQKEVDFLTALVKNYQEYDLRNKNQTATRTVIFIKEQLASISDSLRGIENQLEVFRRQNNTMSDLTPNSEALLKKNTEILNQKNELFLKKRYYNYLNKYLDAEDQLDQIILPSAVGISDPILLPVLNKIVDYQLEIKVISEKGNATSNPLVNNRKSRIRDLKNEIKVALTNLVETDKIKEDFINNELEATNNKMASLPVAQQQFITIKRNYTLLENLYLLLMQKKAEAEISKAATISDINFVDPPKLSGGSLTPNTGRNYSLALFFGLAIPIVIFFLIEILNNRVQSKSDIEHYTTIPFIGGIGHKKGETNLPVLTSPKSVIAESFRALRTNLSYFIGKRDKAVFLIASSISGEGKTFTAINLASVLSLSGKKTLLLGADMRKPKLHNDFELTNEVGLSSYLAGIAEFEEVVKKTKYKDLDVVTGGPVPPNPSELLLQKRMADFMFLAKEKYDYVIIDTPPIALITDAFPLSEFADHTVFVIRQKYTPKQLLVAVQEYYTAGKLKNISIVFNDIYSGPGYEYSDGYTYAYAYGSKDASGYYSN